MRIKLDDGAFKPVRAHSTDAGIDIFSPVCVTVRARSSAMINSGVHVEMRNAAGILLPKSGLNIKHDILSFGVIDEGYNGAIVVKLYNLGDEDYRVYRGDKITQLLEVPVHYGCVEIVDEIESGDRGSNGFGSTGR